MHVCRVVWRYGNKSTMWSIFGFLTVSFGDRPAATLLEVVIRMTIDMFGTIDKMAALSPVM